MKLNCLLAIFFLLSPTAQCYSDNFVEWDKESHGHIKCRWKKAHRLDMQYCFKPRATYYRTMAPQPSSTPSDIPSSEPSPTLEPSIQPTIWNRARPPRPPSALEMRPWFVPWPPLRCPLDQINKELYLKCMDGNDGHDADIYYSNDIYSNSHDHYACLHKLIVDPLSCAEIWCPDYPEEEDKCAAFHRESYADDDYYSRFTFEDDDWNPKKPIWPWRTISPEAADDDV